MSTQFFARLSQNYIDILDDDEHYDITIEVGKDSNVKIFRAHLIILCYRSSYFRRTLANKKNNDDVSVIKLPNISPEIFQIILKYIYGGIISLNEQDTSETIKILVAADEFLLQELVDYLQQYLIQNKAEWMEQNFEITHSLIFQANSLLELQQFCTNFMAQSPEKIFKSPDFISIPEKSLILLIERDDLQLNEVEIWEYVLKWGLKKNPTLTSDPGNWSDDDFKIMENNLQHCLPLIRFFSLSSEEFVQKVHPYRKVLSYQVYEDLLKSYLDPNFKPHDNILLPRHRNINGVIDTNIVNLNIVSIISRWIDNVDVKSKFAYTRELYLPYEFKLLLRGSVDGMTPEKFHKLCDNKPNTVIFIEVEGTKEIIGGYNPSIWKISPGLGEWGKTKRSFIFSFKNKDNFKDPILSQVKNKDKALFYADYHGSSFGRDLLLKNDDGSQVYNYNQCNHQNYEKKIRERSDNFLIQEYEVFQITKK